MTRARQTLTVCPIVDEGIVPVLNSDLSLGYIPELRGNNKKSDTPGTASKFWF